MRRVIPTSSAPAVVHAAKPTATLLAAALLPLMAAGAQAQAALARAVPRTLPTAERLLLTPIRVVSAKADTAPAERGTLLVPENRRDPHSRLIQVAFVRFRSTAVRPGPPIIYLPGGPGQSGIAATRGSRFPLFMALRQYGDVIALDPRGVGASTPNLMCPQSTALPLDRPVAPDVEAGTVAPAVAACARYWRAQGADVNGYDPENYADDIDDLRRALGAATVRLWAISHGTHVALAVIRRHPATVDRAILAGVEGPDHTLKLPSNTQRHLERLDAAAARDSAVRASLASASRPGLLDAVRAVLSRVDSAPVRVRILDRARGDSVSVALGPYDVATILADASGTGDRELLPSALAAALAGDWSFFAEWAADDRRASSVGNLMTYTMDCASGASPGRRTRIAREARETLLGDVTNPAQHRVCAAIGVHPLPAAFRAPVRSDTPALFISGTLDLNAPASNAEEVLAGFPRGIHLVIDGAFHSDPLFLSSPQILEAMEQFLATGTTGITRVAVPVRFAPVGPLPR